MEVFHITGRAPLYTNTFLVAGSDGHAVAIDPAAAAFEYEKLLDEHAVQLTAILLTHGHYDHVDAVRTLREKTGAKVYLRAEDAKGSELFPLTAADIDVQPQDGDVIAVDDMRFTVLTTPGHSRGSVCYLCGELLFSGDTLFAGSCGRYDFEDGSYTDMKASMAKLKAAVPADVQVLPGHEEFSTMAAELEKNPFLNGEEA